MSQRASLDGVAAWTPTATTCPDSLAVPSCSLRLVRSIDVACARSSQRLLNHWIDVETAGTAAQGNLGLTVPTNAGIVIVYDIKHAIDAIDAYMANLADQRWAALPRRTMEVPDAAVPCAPGLWGGCTGERWS